MEFQHLEVMEALGRLYMEWDTHHIPGDRKVTQKVSPRGVVLSSDDKPIVYLNKNKISLQGMALNHYKRSLSPSISYIYGVGKGNFKGYTLHEYVPGEYSTITAWIKSSPSLEQIQSFTAQLIYLSTLHGYSQGLAEVVVLTTSLSSVNIYGTAINTYGIMPYILSYRLPNGNANPGTPLDAVTYLYRIFPNPIVERYKRCISSVSVGKVLAAIQQAYPKLFHAPSPVSSPFTTEEVYSQLIGEDNSMIIKSIHHREFLSTRGLDLSPSVSQLSDTLFEYLSWLYTHDLRYSRITPEEKLNPQSTTNIPPSIDDTSHNYQPTYQIKPFTNDLLDQDVSLLILDLDVVFPSPSSSRSPSSRSASGRSAVGTRSRTSTSFRPSSVPSRPEQRLLDLAPLSPPGSPSLSSIFDDPEELDLPLFDEPEPYIRSDGTAFYSSYRSPTGDIIYETNKGTGTLQDLGLSPTIEIDSDSIIQVNGNLIQVYLSGVIYETQRDRIYVKISTKPNDEKVLNLMRLVLTGLLP